MGTAQLTDKSLTNPLRLMREASTVEAGVAPTQEQAAYRMGLDWSSLWRYEEGKVIPPKAICRLLIVTYQPDTDPDEVATKADMLREELIIWKAANTPDGTNQPRKRKEGADDGEQQ